MAKSMVEMMDRKAISEQNGKLLSSITELYIACKELADRGFKIIRTRIGDKCPEVLIANSKRCSSLGGTQVAVRVGRVGREQVMAARVKGVQVIWVVRGN